MRSTLTAILIGALLALTITLGAQAARPPLDATAQIAAGLADAARAAVAEAAKALPQAWPHSSSDIVNVRGRAAQASEVVETGASISTTTVNAMAAVADVSFDDDITQSFRVINTHASQNLCLAVIARANAAETCSAACGAVAGGALTCTGSGAADGILLPGGSTLPFTMPVVGSDCLCAEASAASTTYNITRVARSPNQ